MVVTEQLKDRFRIVLGRFLQKKAERDFEEMAKLIETFDLGTYEKIKSMKSKSTNIKKGQVNLDINDFKLDVI